MNREGEKWCKLTKLQMRTVRSTSAFALTAAITAGRRGDPVATSPNKISQPCQPFHIDLVKSILDFTIHVDEADHHQSLLRLSILPFWIDQEDRDNDLASTFSVAGNMSRKGMRVWD